MILLALTAALVSTAPVLAQPAAAEEPAVVDYALPDLDIVVRVPLDDPSHAWQPPPWALVTESSLALQPAGEQIVAMFEEVQREYQPRFDDDDVGILGPVLARQFIDDVYAGPELGAITWGDPQLVEHPILGRYLRVTAEVELPEREDVGGLLAISLYPVRAGLNATVVVGVTDPERLIAAEQELAGMIRFINPPVAEEDMPTGHVVDPAGYELDLPDGFRALTERERTALRGEPVGGNSGYGGALSYQWYFDPSSVGGHHGFGCAAYSADTLEIVDPAKAPRLADNYRLAASLILKGGTYRIDGGKPIRGRPADLLDTRTLVVDPTVPGDLRTIQLADRPAYLWRTEGKRVAASGDEEEVVVSTFYTAYSDVNLHCQAAAPPTDTRLMDEFASSMATVTITDGAAHPLELGLMARYKQWWPYSHPLLQLYWVPVPVILFAAWLANRED